MHARAHTHTHVLVLAHRHRCAHATTARSAPPCIPTNLHLTPTPGQPPPRVDTQATTFSARRRLAGLLRLTLTPDRPVPPQVDTDRLLHNHWCSSSSMLGRLVLHAQPTLLSRRLSPAFHCHWPLLPLYIPLNVNEKLGFELGYWIRFELNYHNYFYVYMNYPQGIGFIWVTVEFKMILVKWLNYIRIELLDCNWVISLFEMLILFEFGLVAEFRC
jgi:hypothetical protein